MSRGKRSAEPLHWVEVRDSDEQLTGWYATQGSTITVRWPDGSTRTARASTSSNQGLAMLMLSEGPKP